MVQDNGTKLCSCTSHNISVINQSKKSKLSSPAGDSKYSTFNFVSSRFQPAKDYYKPSPPISSQTQNRSYWDKYIPPACLVGLIKFIQHQCYTTPKKKRDETFLIIHSDVFAAMKQLKCDLDTIVDFQNTGNLNKPKNCDNSKKILTRMTCKILEIEDKLMKSNVLTCRELLAKRKFILALIRNIQKTVGTYLECEALAMRGRQAKLCNLLKCLQYIENEFRCMTKGVKSQCCPTVCDKTVPRVKSVHAVNSLTKKESCLKTSTKPSTPVAENSKNYSLTENNKNYEVTGVDVVYTKSTVKSLDPCKDIVEENTCICDNIIEKECIEKKIACHVPPCGEPVCEVQIRDGNETLQLCNSEPVKDIVSQISQVWQESAKQLINAFHSC